MNLLKDIEIFNFRGIDKLEIKGMNQINLFFGKNNSGKSTILETLFLIVGMSNPALPESINRFRGLNVNSGEDFKSLYHKLKFSNIPKIKCVFSDFSERELKIDPLYKQAVLGTETQQKSISENYGLDISTASPKVTGIELKFSTRERNKPKKTYTSNVIFNQPEIIQNQPREYKEDLHAVFIFSGTAGNDKNVLDRYAELVKRKKGDLVLNALQKIDTNIESIQALPQGIYLSYLDIDELIPINLAGDGVRRYFNIVTTIAERQNSIILIDEIENGLHYSAHRLLWQNMLILAKEFNVQLFLTTHSIETLESLNEALQTNEFSGEQEKLSVFTIADTKKKGKQSYKYSFSGFKDALETGTELRS